MPWLRVLRGCFSAYVLGVVMVVSGMMVVEGEGLQATGFVALFGLFAMIPFTVVALIIWAVLAGMDKQISAAKAIAICGAVFTVAGGFFAAIEGTVLWALAIIPISYLVGCVFGAAFWVGAFGMVRDVHARREEA